MFPLASSDPSPLKTSAFSPSRVRHVLLGTIETFDFWSRTRLSDCRHSSIIPFGTDGSLKTLTQHFVLGYFRQITHAG
jgi:hypothetical protein